jgi:hypothetical protein
MTSATKVARLYLLRHGRIAKYRLGFGVSAIPAPLKACVKFCGVVFFNRSPIFFMNGLPFTVGPSEEKKHGRYQNQF